MADDEQAEQEHEEEVEQQPEKKKNKYRKDKPWCLSRCVNRCSPRYVHRDNDTIDHWAVPEWEDEQNTVRPHTCPRFVTRCCRAVTSLRKAPSPLCFLSIARSTCAKSGQRHNVTYSIVLRDHRTAGDEVPLKVRRCLRIGSRGGQYGGQVSALIWV